MAAPEPNYRAIVRVEKITDAWSEKVYSETTYHQGKEEELTSVIISGDNLSVLIDKAKAHLDLAHP